MEILFVLLGLAVVIAGAVGVRKLLGYVFRMNKDLISLAKDIHHLNEQLGDLGNQLDDFEREMLTEDNLDLALRDFQNDIESFEQELDEMKDNNASLYDWLGLLHSSVIEVTLRATMDRNTRDEILEALESIRAKF